MPPLSPKTRSVRGFGVFSRVITQGTSYEHVPIKAFIFTSPSITTSLRIGYTVTKKIRNAAHRNRLKRLMREAFRLELKEYIKLHQAAILTEIVFMYIDRSGIHPKRVSFHTVRQAIKNICGMIPNK